MTIDRAKRRAQQAVALYEQRILAGCDRREIATSYHAASELVAQYGIELDSAYNTDKLTDYTDYYNLQARLDLTIEQYNNIFCTKGE